MKFALLVVYALFSLALVRSHAVTPEVYWKSVLPKSTMPKAIRDLLYTAGVGTGGVHAKSADQLKGMLKSDTYINYGGGHSKDQFKDMLKSDTYINYGGGHSKDQFKGMLKSDTYINYGGGHSKNDYSNQVLFFLENDLHLGTEMKLQFMIDNQKATFLPREVTDSIPFSSNKLSQIYKKFSIKSNSLEAIEMKQTLSNCERKGTEGEEKYCATSLESMVDFSTTKLGKKVKAISTEVNAKGSTPLQKYTVEHTKKLAADIAVVCHKQNYVYAVFYCHKTVSIRAYAVSLVGTDGTKAMAVAVCHTDTAKWNPKHLAFQLLKVKPGSVPVCHFLPEDTVVWVPY